MKITYFFCPNGQWNITTEVAYNYLAKFYGPEYLMTREEQE